jgi:hypothetical protein
MKLAFRSIKVLDCVVPQSGFAAFVAQATAFLFAESYGRNGGEILQRREQPMFDEGIREVRSDDRGSSILKEIVENGGPGKPG